ncbi:hypothetical protein [Intrasporangium sp.]|uniref:alpha/beta hydrolase family protein n=1 Tax=Intrasporangium sp. TaxID=1925024 RepID=UPI00293A56E0|nr:hypothetical protein [Intrasporangium sp.]MDV3223422.1 hypothetical protein [Intrasporangium sp.]
MKGSTRTWLAVAGVATGACAVLLGVGKSVVLPQFRFPAPSGPYAIGTVTQHWVDPARAEILGPAAGQHHREVVAQFWYPAEPSAAQPTSYLAEPDAVVPALAGLFGMPQVTLRHLGGITTNAVQGATVAAGGHRFPVVLLLSGLGGFRQATTFLAEELASHGYVVVGLDQPYTAAAVAFPDGRVARLSSIEQVRPLVRQSYLPAATPPELDGVPLDHGVVPFLSADVSFALDQLERLNRAPSPSHPTPSPSHPTRSASPRPRPDAVPVAGRLDLDRVGVAGVSLGGLVVGEAVREEPRIKAALMLDAPVPVRTSRSSLDVPCMWLTRPPEAMRLERERAGGWSEDEIQAHHSTMRATFERLNAPGYFVQIPDISHLDFTDAPLWSPALGWLGMTGPKDGSYAHAVINDYALSFFQKYLDGADIPLLDGPPNDHPEVTLDVHVATAPQEVTP